MTIKLTPAKCDIEFTAGTDLDDLYLVFTDDAGAAVAVNGYTIEAKVLRGTTVLATDFTSTVSGAGNNIVKLAMTDAETTTLGVERGLTWSLRMTLAGITKEWVAGDIVGFSQGNGRSGDAGQAKVFTVGEINVTLTSVAPLESIYAGVAAEIDDPASGISTAIAGQYSPLGVQAPGSTIVWFGDSYIARSGTQSYADDATRDASGPAMWCEALLYGRLSPLGNAGANGETTAQFLSRITDVTNLSPKIVGLLTAGINDVKGAVTSATTIANLTAIFDTLIEAGSIVVTSTIPPSDLIDTTDEIAALFAVNRWLMTEAITRPGLVVVDCYSLLALSSIVDWRSEYDNDGTHPNTRGAYVIGKAFADAIDRIIPQETANIVRSDADPDEIMPNPTMSGTGGSGTGTIPASVTSTGGTGTGSKVARTDGIPGDWFYWDQSTGTNTILQSTTTGFATGDRLQAQVELHIDIADWSPTSYYVYVEQRTAGNVVINSVETYLAASGDVPLHDPIVVRVNPLTVDATAASVRVAIRQVGAGICRVGLMSLRNLG